MELSHHGERREGSHYQHTQETGFIFYTTYSLFMGVLHSWHIMIMNGVWLHRELWHRMAAASECSFSFLHRALFEVFRVVRVGITGHTEQNADLLELGPGPGQQSELRTVLQPICLLLTKIAYRYSLGRGTGSALDKCNKETLCNYSMFFLTVLQARKGRYIFEYYWILPYLLPMLFNGSLWLE